jgi:hypothetical protein
MRVDAIEGLNAMRKCWDKVVDRSLIDMLSSI